MMRGRRAWVAWMGAALVAGCADAGEGASSVAGADAGGDAAVAGGDAAAVGDAAAFGDAAAGGDVTDVGGPSWGDGPLWGDVGGADAGSTGDGVGGPGDGGGSGDGGGGAQDGTGAGDVADAAADAGADGGLADVGTDAGGDGGADAGAGGGVDAVADGGADAGPDGVDPPLCDPADLGDMGDPDRPRVVLIGHPFTAKPAVPGTDIRSMSLEPGGLPVDDGMLLDVGVRPARMAFVPSGAYALVVGDDGDVVSVQVGNAQHMNVVDAVKLPSADYGDIAVSADGTIAWVVGLNVNETSGVSVVHVGCDGALTVDEAGFLNIRLTESMAVLPGEQTAVLLGGQAVFAPVDPHDLRLLGRDGDAWIELGAYDVFQDFVNTGRIAASPDGSTVLVPNASVFSDEEGQIAVLSTAGGTLTEIDRITTLHGVSEALFGLDGQTALISRPEVNRVAILSDMGAGLEPTGEIKGLGLADQMVLIRRGSLAGTVLIPSVDSNGGPNLAVLRIDGVGVVSDLGQVELGSGSLDIPDAIAVMP